MLNKNVVNFIGCDAEYDESSVVLFGVPFDSTTSFRPGARFGPSAARNESYGIETYSPYLDEELTDFKVFDSGDLELPIGDSRMVLDMIEEREKAILDSSKLPFMVGGEHLVTLGAIRAVAAKYPDVNIIHFDAHADLRQDYLGVELSHACVMRRASELLGKGRIYQFGIRSGDKSEFVRDDDDKKRIVTTRFGFEGLDNTVKELAGKPVYFSLDLDILDPSILPGTGTPEAGGVGFIVLLRAIETIFAGNAEIVGMDVCELAPNLDPSGVSTAVTCKLISEMLLGYLSKNK